MSWPGLDSAKIKMVNGYPFHLPWWHHMTCTNALDSKAAFTIAFFAAVDHNYNHKQLTSKHRNTQNGPKSTNHKSQTMTFWTRWRKVLFPKRSTEMIDGSETLKRRRLLNFGIRVSLKSAVTDFSFNGSVLVFNRFQCNKDWVLQSWRRIVCGSWTKWSELKM